jgi:hypothetical protein
MGFVDEPGFIGKSSKTRAGEHRNNCLRYHGHIDDHRGSLFNHLPFQYAGEFRNLVKKFPVSKLLDGIRYRTIVYKGCLVAAASLDMPVKGIVAGVQLSAGKPAVKGLVRIVQDLVPLPVPVDRLCCLPPECFRILNALPEDLVVPAHPVPPRLSFFLFFK